MLSPDKINQLLAPFEISLDSAQLDHLVTYIDLLLRWNSKINLIGPATEEECVTRHFGESLYLSRFVALEGSLLDIGSGAGFPGLALKLVAPSLGVTLLEPTAKKRAFLKEVSRECRFDAVTVCADWLEQFAGNLEEPVYDFATARAVGGIEALVQGAGKCLKTGGRLCLWVGHDQEAEIRATCPRFSWDEPIPIPLSRRREIWIGTLG